MFGYELAWSIFVYFTSPLLISSPQQVVPFYSPVLAFKRTMIRAMLRMIMIRAVRMLRVWKIMWMMLLMIIGIKMTIRIRMTNFVKQSYLALSSAFMMLRDWTERTWKCSKCLSSSFTRSRSSSKIFIQNHYLKPRHICHVFWYSHRHHQKHQNRRYSFFSSEVMRITTSHYDLWCCWRFWTRQRFTE